MTTFLLIRHGHTDAVNEYIAGTAAGTPLSELGHRQVNVLTERLRGVPLTAVLASPLTRTMETATPIARSHDLDVLAQPAFGEFEFGAWTGRRFRDDLDADPLWQRFNRVRSLTHPPRGELMLDVQQRAITALLAAATAFPGGRVAVVSHGDVIRAALMYILGTPLDFVHRLEISPASVSIVTVDGDGAVVRQVNGDNGHAAL
jgi:broad specificity phosphatase PhoE